MAEFPYLPLWTDAYLADTRHLSTEEHGAYMLLMMEAWRRPSCALPDDDRLLARLSGLSEDAWQRAKPIVMAFWTFDGRSKEWRQKRLMKEREKTASKTAKSRDAAASRWKKTKKDDAGAMRTQCPSDAIQNHNQSQKEERGKPLSCAPSLDTTIAAGFASFYAAFPRKQSKKSAEEKFARIVRKGEATIEQLVEGAKRYAIETAGRDPAHICHPSTWLNQARWQDEPLPLAPINGGPHGPPPSRGGRQAAYDGAAEERRRFARALDGAG